MIQQNSTGAASAFSEFRAFASSGDLVPSASTELLTETQQKYLSMQDVVKKIIWGSSIPYALFITSIYAMFAIKRADGVPGYVALFAATSLLFNVFGALLFPKRTAGLISDFSHRHDDMAYITFFTSGTLLALMTVIASIEISQSSVSAWPAGAMWVATIAFGMNTFLTRLVGGVDVLDRMRRQIEFYTVFKFLNEFELKKDLLREATSTVEGGELEPVQWIADQMRAVPTPKLRLISDWTQWGVRVGLAAISLCLIPMWISMTQNGLDKLHPTWGDQAEFVTVAAMSNALFYGLSCYDVFPATKDLYQKLSEKLAKNLEPHITNLIAEKLVRHVIVTTAMAAFAVGAYYSGGGFGATVIGMEKNGFGSVAIQMTPDWFFTVMRGFYSNFTQAIAGLVNLNSTARFMLAVLNKQKELDGENLFFTMLNFMELYKREKLSVTSADDIQASHLGAPLPVAREDSLTIQPSMFDLVETMMKRTRSAVIGNKFVQEEHGEKRRRSCRNLLALVDDTVVNVTDIKKAYSPQAQALFKLPTERTALVAASSVSVANRGI
ncbi:MAG: hypothetical protein Q8L78_01355 [Coxiellaceae bacterium]|nr:hypothetical protein [Coxiellaceae bacterium]